MTIHNNYYLIESGEILEKVEGFRQEYIKKHREIMEYAESLGGDGFRVDHKHRLKAIRFKGSPPKGFKKPDSDGCCAPYKRSKKLHKEFSEHAFPDQVEWMKEYLGCPILISFKYPNGSGSTIVGHPFNPIEILWYSLDGPLCLVTPDIEYYVRKIRSEEGDGVVFENNEDQWCMDKSGVREIFEEEWALMVAKYNLEDKEILEGCCRCWGCHHDRC